MDAMSSPVTRRVRAIAVVAVLLCAFTTVAPLLARESGSHHPRSHAAKVVNAALSDQQNLTLRLDQTGAVLPVPGQQTRQVTVAGTPAAIVVADAAVVDSARTRGPPTDAS